MNVEHAPRRRRVDDPHAEGALATVVGVSFNDIMIACNDGLLLNVQCSMRLKGRRGARFSLLTLKHDVVAAQGG